MRDTTTVLIQVLYLGKSTFERFEVIDGMLVVCMVWYGHCNIVISLVGDGMICFAVHSIYFVCPVFFEINLIDFRELTRLRGACHV